MAGGNIAYFVIAALLFFLCIWCVYDAFDRTDYGFIWLFFIATTGPVAALVYVAMRFYVDRPTSKSVLLARELEREKWRSFRLGSEIERARFIEAADRGGGTMFDPNAGLSVSPEGFRHFSDQRADALLQAGRYDEAWDYLIDLLQLAQSESDGRAVDTYRHYIHRLPSGAALLADWQRAAGQPSATAAGPKATAAEVRTAPGSGGKRQVPF